MFYGLINYLIIIISLFLIKKTMDKPVFKTLKNSALLQVSQSNINGLGKIIKRKSMKSKNPGINFGRWTAT